MPAHPAALQQNTAPGRDIMDTLGQLKRAIETRAAATLIGLYADNAIIRISDRDNPSSAPRELKGKTDIAAYFTDVCGRAMTHEVETGLETPTGVAFTQACAYPDGTKVFCSAMLEMTDGKIARQTVVQAWDA